MRVCHAFLFFSIKYAGGTCDLMYKLCKAQAKIGIQPVVYTGDHHFDAELADSLPGTEFRVLKSYFDKSGFSIMPGLASMLRHEIATFDIVHMHVFRTFQNYMFYRFCQRNNVPYVIDAHGAVPYYTRKVCLKKWYDGRVGRRMLEDACRLVAESKVGVHEYLDIHPKLRQDRIEIISPPFDTEEYRTLPQRGFFRNEWRVSEEHIIMFLGRLHHIKGLDFLIEGFAELLKRRQDVRLMLVGPNDGFQETLVLLAKKLGVTEKVTFTGFLYAEQKLSALVDADIVIQVSRQEQGAWAPFEAVLAGTPIIVSAHTGAGEDVRRVDAGYLVDFGNHRGLADQIEFILENYQEAKQKTLTAKRFIEDNLSMDARVNEYTELYQQCIDHGKAGLPQ